MRKSLPTDGRIVRMMSALNADRLRTLGGLMSAWCLIDEHTETGKLDGYTAAAFDEIIGFPGLALAMESVGWLEIGDGYLQAPDFERHNGTTAKRRAQESVRKMSARNADKCPHPMQTKCAPEKRREENSNTPVVPKGTDLDLNLDSGNEPATKTPRQPKTNHGQRIHAMFNRGPRASWSDKELKALSRLEPFDTDDFDLVEKHYLTGGSGHGYIRTDVQTFLNNYQGEVDRAKGKQNQPKPASKPVNLSTFAF